ncbi:secY protein [Pediococcus claussenii]|nr:secY protein [Pediococcus claussenii]
MMMIALMELGRHIAIPFLDPQGMKDVLKENQLLQNLSTTTGGQVNYPSLFSIGLAPYMTGMIMFQAIKLLDIDSIKKMSEYQSGMTQRGITFVLACLQSFQLVYLVRQHITKSSYQIFGFDANAVSALVILVTGSMLVAWMADMTVDRGMGGAGILIFPGIFEAMPRSLINGQGLGTGFLELTPTILIVFAISVVVVLFSTLFLNKSELRIPLQRPMIENDFSESYVPIKVLAAGGMPFMFSSALFMIPGYIATLGTNQSYAEFVSNYLNFNNPIGIAIYCGIIVLLGYAFSLMNFRPEDTAKTLKESGDYFFGVVPGKQTQSYLTKRLMVLSTFANIFFVVVIGAPLVIGMYIDGIANFSFVFSNILILVTILDNILDQAKVLYLRTQYNLMEL